MHHTTTHNHSQPLHHTTTPPPPIDPPYDATDTPQRVPSRPPSPGMPPCTIPSPECAEHAWHSPLPTRRTQRLSCIPQRRAAETPSRDLPAPVSPRPPHLFIRPPLAACSPVRRKHRPRTPTPSTDQPPHHHRPPAGTHEASIALPPSHPRQQAAQQPTRQREVGTAETTTAPACPVPAAHNRTTWGPSLQASMADSR